MSKTAIVIGIDPGFSGGIAILTSKHLTVHPMPLLQKSILFPSDKRHIDLVATSTLISHIAPHTVFAVIEEVSAAPNQGVVSTFRFGEGYGSLLGILAANRIQTHKVRPGVWKSALSLSSNKQLSLDLATKLWPDLSPTWKLKKNDGLAEAALLAHYGRRSFNLDPMAALL